MPYSKQTFNVGSVLTAAQQNQIEENIASHVHGTNGVVGQPLNLYAQGTTAVASYSLTTAATAITVASFAVNGGDMDNRTVMRITVPMLIEGDAEGEFIQVQFYVGSTKLCVASNNSATDEGGLFTFICQADSASNKQIANITRPGPGGIGAFVVGSGAVDLSSDRHFSINVQLTTGNDRSFSHGIWFAERIVSTS